MAKADEPIVTFRLTVLAPVKGCAYSLQDRNSQPEDVRISTGRSLVFDVPVRLAEGQDGWRFLGDHVRTEGKSRRFFYIATGAQAGQESEWDRRAKIDFPDITPALLRSALKGGLVLEASMQGQDGKGEPACATITLVSGWAPRRAA